MKVGRRLAIKILNVGKFVLSLGAVDGPAAPVTEPIDPALLAALAGVVDEATAAFDDVQLHPRARGHRVVLLVVLRRLRGAGEGPGVRRSERRAAASAQATLPLALSVQLRLFAPVLPFVTEEVWSWWQAGSVHRAAWPVAAEVAALAPGRRRCGAAGTAEALAAVRKAKSEAKLSMRADVASATVTGPQHALDRVAEAGADLQATGRIAAWPSTPATARSAPLSPSEHMIGRRCPQVRRRGCGRCPRAAHWDDRPSRGEPRA